LQSEGGKKGSARAVNEQEDDQLKRFWRVPEYWLLVVAALASMFGVAWWVVVPLTLAGLSVSSLLKYIELWPRAERVGAQAEWWKTVALSTLTASRPRLRHSCLGTCCSGCGQYCNGTNWINMGGISSNTPAAGTTGQIQFNTSNNVDAEPALTCDKTNERLGGGRRAPQ
jgi:hypothetical protein